MFDNRNNVRLGAPFGVPVVMNRMVLIVIVFLSLVDAVKGGVHALNALTWPLLLLSIYVHELAHALSARLVGGHADGIALHIFGGLTFTRGVVGTRNNVIVSAAGPLMNIAVGAVLALLFGAAEVGDGPMAYLVQWLWIVNLFWGFVNLLPIFPLDGGHILQTLASTRMSQARTVALSALVSLITLGLSAVFAILYRQWIVLAFVAFLVYLNFQRWARARQAGASIPGLGDILGRGGPRAASGRREPRQAQQPPRSARTVHDLAEDDARVRRVLSRGVKVGLGGLSPEDRRLIMVHRSLLEAKLARRGFEGLDSDERELLALHHDMEDRTRPQ